MASTPDQAAAARPRADERTGVVAGPWLLVSYGIALALLAWPIAQVTNPMLADYPNHLARLHVAGALATSETLGRFYVHQAGLYPYLPFDLLVGLLGRAIGLEPAGRVFIALAVAMPSLGTLVLARALHGRVGLWPIVSTLFAYNLLLSWGLITYLFTLGLALLVFAAWITTERWAWPRRLALFAVLAALIFCAHPFAFAALALLVGTWEAGRLRSLEWTDLKATGLRLLLAGLQFMPAALLATQVPRTDVGSDITRFGPLAERLAALFSPLLFLGDASEVFLACALALAFVIALRHGGLAFDRRMILPVAGAGIVSLLMPAFVSGIYLVHARLPLLVVLLLIASCRPRALPARTVGLALALAASLLTLRTADVAARLIDADRQVAELRAASFAIEEGARVLPAAAVNRGLGMPAKNYWHATAYLTIDRSAFFPLLFSFFNIGITPEYVAAAAPATAPVRLDELELPEGVRPRPALRDIYWRNWRRDFDYIVLFDFGDDSLRLPDGLALVRRGEAFAIYKIVR